MNNTKNVDDRKEYRRVFYTVSRKALNEAREMLEKNPQQFYNQLVALLVNAEAQAYCGTDYEDDSIQRDIFDTIQGIAARDSKIRKFEELCAKIQQEHPDMPKHEREKEAYEQMKRWQKALKQIEKEY